MAIIRHLAFWEEAPEEPRPYIVVTRSRRERGPGSTKIRHPGSAGYAIIFTRDAPDAELK